MQTFFSEFQSDTEKKENHDQKVQAIIISETLLKHF